MKRSNISASIRGCSAAETQALTLWSVAQLPQCQLWAAAHGLHPPREIVERLQQMRFDMLQSGRQFEALLTLFAVNRSVKEHTEHNSKLEKVATHLSCDLQQMQHLTSYAGAGSQQHFLTTARDLRRFQRASLHLQFTALELVASEPIIVTLFSPQRMALYLPCWLINALPQTLFEPNQSFYRPRRASLAWLVFDALVIASTDEFKTL